MKKNTCSLFFFIFCFMVTSLWAQEKSLQKIHKNAKKGEKAYYLIQVKSPFGTSKIAMNLHIYKVGSIKMKIRKTLKNKGNTYIKTNDKFPLTGNFIDHLEEEIRKTWDKAQIEKKISKITENIELNDSVEITQQYVDERGNILPKKTKTLQETSFTCYKVTFNITGTYPKNKPDKAKVKEYPKKVSMKITYWISPEVPVFGIVKVSGVIIQNIQKHKIQSKVEWTLKKYIKIIQK